MVCFQDVSVWSRQRTAKATLHAGYLVGAGSQFQLDSMPHEVTREVCDHCKALGQSLHLETGQETADDLIQFISDVDRDNLFVNFDPANMILYGTGEPIEALKKIGDRVRSVVGRLGLERDCRRPGRAHAIASVGVGAGADTARPGTVPLVRAGPVGDARKLWRGTEPQAGPDV